MEIGKDNPVSGSKHLFEGIKSDSVFLTLKYKVVKKPLEYGGEISSSIRSDLDMLNIPASIIKRASIAAYEAEMNILSYTDGGDFTIILHANSIEMRIEDSGPGIPDIDKAMRPGYSTAPDWIRALGFGAGMGLVNIKNSSDEFKITSNVGVGTCLEIKIRMEGKCI